MQHKMLYKVKTDACIYVPIASPPLQIPINDKNVLDQRQNEIITYGWAEVWELSASELLQS